MAIYIGTHKRLNFPVQCDWWIPLGLGGYRDSVVRRSDDDGHTSIASLNVRLNELTGLWHLLHHCGDVYVGFVHYRRFLSFIPLSIAPNNYPAFLELRASQSLMHFLQHPRQQQRIHELLNVYDVILPKAFTQAQTVANAYRSIHDSTAWDIFVDVCVDDFGFDRAHFDVETRFYYANLFVFRLDEFRAYTKMLFAVLAKVRERVGELAADPGVRYCPSRYAGYLSERFMSFYVHHKRLRVAEVPHVFIA